MELASCIGKEDLFIRPEMQRTPAAKARINAALTICELCPVLNQCRSWADEMDMTPHPWKGVIVAGRLYPNNVASRKER